MEDPKSSTKLLLLSGVVMLIVLLTGPLGYKFGMVDLMPSLVSLLVALIGSVLVFVAAIIYVIFAVKQQRVQDRNLLLVTMLISLIPIMLIGPQLAKARSVPPIHDITTDTVDPPQFNAIVKRRVHALNSLEYGSEQLPASELAAMQHKAYPNIQPLQSNLTVSDALDRAEEVLQDQGLEIIAVDKEAGLLEATATTYWFGFKDDVAVRIVPLDEGSLIDVRSISRVGQSDVGANAERIEKFLTAF